MRYLLLAVVFSCGCSGSGAPASSSDSTQLALTYYQQTKAILDARCVPCHSATGIGPFRLDEVDSVRSNAKIAAEALRSHLMPPFPPDDASCRPIDDPRKITDAERAMLVDWFESGTPLGDPQAPSAIEIPGAAETLGAPTNQYQGGLTYVPPVTSEQYRCFLVDPQLTAPWTFLRSLGITTTNWQRIHHSIVYVVPPSQVDAARAADAAEDGPGYDCYFGSKVDGAIAAGGYAPGSFQKPYPDGTTIPIQAGSQFIVELHFHQTYNQDPVEFAVATWEFPAPVARYPDALPLFTSHFTIPAFAPSTVAPMSGRFVASSATPLVTTDPDAVHEAREGLIWGLDFHMHQRGKTARVDLVHEDGTSECLLSIPAWNDHWQGNYFFVDPVVAHAGDHVEAACEWDNSAEHQPFLNGRQIEPPTDLHWGFNVLDEMCNSSMSLTHD